MCWSKIFIRSFQVALATILVATPCFSVPRYVFVTSASGNGALGGWLYARSMTAGADAGDAICQDLASTAGLSNSSAYRAWLSTSTADAFCRVQGLTGTRNSFCGGASSAEPAIGPWVRMDGTPFAERLADMVGPDVSSPMPVVYQPISYDEWGAVLPELGGYVWTGTSPYGQASTGTCSDWISGVAGSSGTIGLGWRVGRTWTSWADFPCDGSFRLICLEIGPGDTLELPAESGALAFVTSVFGDGKLGDWPDAGVQTGLAAGNAICQARARAGHLPQPDSYVAWLSDGITNAITAITTDGPFSRVDGFALAATKNALIGGYSTLHGTGINVTELGAYYLDNTVADRYIWTGTEYDGLGSDKHCATWGSNLAVDQGRTGSSDAARGTWTQTGLSSCSTVRPIYCISNAVLLFWDNFERGNASRWSSMVPP